MIAKTNVFLFLFIYLVGINFCFAQHDNMLSGRVIDSKTKQPIPFATVFLANTLIGTRASAEGYYKLINIALGKYDLTISSVGYNLISNPVLIGQSENKLDVELLQEVKTLKEVVVKSNQSDYLRNLKIFKKYFLGETRNALKCNITNSSDIEFEYDDEKKILSAYCDQPLIIENQALGYRVFYFLKMFRLDSKEGYCTVAGTPRFELLIPKNNTQASRWTKERDRAYHGSVYHFMRSLKNNALYENKFSIYLMSKYIDSLNMTGLGKEIRDDTAYTVYPIKYRSDLYEKEFKERILLKIVYEGENQEINFSQSRDLYLLQTSYLEFKKHGLVIYDNGYYLDPLSYYMDGYLGWSTKVAELLPLEYQPRANTQQNVAPKK